VEFKRGTDAGVIHQGLYYMAWLMDHKAEFRHLVRDRLGAAAAAQVLWSAPRLICVAGDFTRYDVHAVREHRRSIDLVRYRFFGEDLLGLETVASVTGRTPAAKRVRQRAAGLPPACGQSGALAELAEGVDEVLLGLGDGVSWVQRKQYRAYQRLRNFACVCPPQMTKLLVYLKADPRDVDLVPGFTRDVTGLGHHGTGDLEVQLRTPRDVERAQELFRASYAAA
jgi:predicted transport protein